MKHIETVKRSLSLLLVLVMLLGVLPMGMAAETGAEKETVITLDFDAAGAQKLAASYFTEEEDGWAYDANSSYDVTEDFYKYAGAADREPWDYYCLRLRQTAANGMAVLRFTAPLTGTYTMDLTYGVGNNANQTEVYVGGTTTAFHAWGQYGAPAKSITTENVVLEAGSNEISFTTLTATSMIFIKEITFTLVEAAEVEPTVVTLDFDAAADEGRGVTKFTEFSDGWAYDETSSHDVTPSFYQNSKWDYSCLRLTQTAIGGTGVLRFQVPVAGTYKMEITYCVGNNGNYVEVEAGGITTGYFAWANWGAAPKTATAEGLSLMQGSNVMTITTPANATYTSLLMVKQVVFTLVKAADEENITRIDLDFDAEAAKEKGIANYTEEADGWAIDYANTVDAAPMFYQHANWEYKALRFTQKGAGGTGALTFTAPKTGTYRMEAVYCTGNSGTNTELKVGGTTTSYHAWANWGAAPNLAVADNVYLTEGSNLLTVTCPESSASYMMLRRLTFTLMGSLSVSASDGLVMHPDDADGIALQVFAKDGNGVAVDLSDASVSFESLDTSIAEVSEDGIATPVSCGSAPVKVTATLHDGTVLETLAWVSVSEGKAASTYYTKEKREAALYNAYNTNWGKRERVVAVKAADTILENLDAYYDMVTFEGLPRAESAGMSEDPLYQYCPMCSTDLIAGYGNYAWKTDPLNDPWKIICPACNSRFPSNDFASYYRSGLDAQGVFHAENADESYLVNELYPEKGEGWGVDDGWGWNTGESYTNAAGGKSPRIYAFVAVYNGLGIWGGQNSDTSIDDVLNTLREAYLYTGDMKYGRAGAILIDRVTDAYATMSLTDAVYKKPRSNISYLTVSTLPAGTIPFTNNHGTYYQGRALGCITESNFLAKDLLKAYDAFYPAFDDPEVVAYLSERAEAQGLVTNGENPKDTPTELRENGINGLVHKISEGVRNRDIWGNFGLAESTMALAAVILDSDAQLSEPVDEPLNKPTGDRRKMNTHEMIAWLFEVGTHAHKNMLDEIIKSISRDGHGDEVSPQYHLTWLKNFIDFADAMDGYTGYPGADLYENPRFIKMLTGALALTAGGNTTLQNGDAGTAGGVRIYLDQNAIVRAFQATGGVELAQALYFLNGNKSEGIVGDMFDMDAEQVSEKVQAIIDEYGPYDVDRSVLLAGYGQALLKYGTKAEANQGLYGLWFGRIAGGHGNRNALGLSLFAYGLNFAPDFGYPQAASSSVVRNVWERGTVSRNTVVIDDKSQENLSYLQQYPNTEPFHFDDAGYVKVMDAESAKAYGGLADEYRRTMVAVQGDDDAYYAVDFFRVSGGSTHLYSFHAAAENDPVSDSIEPVAQQGTYAGADVAYGANVENGYSFLYDVKTDDSPANSFYLDYEITDHRKVLKDPEGLHLRLNMLSDENEPFTEVTLAKGNPPAKGDNPAYYPYSLIRKDGSDSLFTAVYEPYRTTRYLDSMELVDVTVKEGALSETDRAAAVKILRADGKVEYIVYCTNYDAVLRVDDRFDFSGFVGVVTYESDAADAGVTYRYGMDATIVAGKLQEYPAATGTVLDFTHALSDENTITVTLNETIDAASLVGRVIYVENDGEENGAYTIEGAVEAEGSVILDVGTQSPVRALLEPANANGGYVYNIAEGQSFRIPMSAYGEPAPEIEKFDVAGVNMTLGNELELNIMLPKATVDAYGKDLTVTVIHHEYVDGDTEYTFKMSELPLYGGGRYYKASIRVAAAQMTDLVDVVVTDAEGNVYSNVFTTSVLTYVTNNLDKQAAKVQTLLVDMVNYGAAAQDNFTYRQDLYANSNLTESQKLLATGDVTCTDIRVKGTNYVGSNLSLQDCILLNFMFTGVSDDVLATMTATVEFTGVLGNEVNVTVPAQKLMNRYAGVAVNQIVLADAVTPVTVTLYNADGTVYGYATDSVESYNARQNPNGTNALYNNIMKFAASALAYKQ